MMKLIVFIRLPVTQSQTMRVLSSGLEFRVGSRADSLRPEGASLCLRLSLKVAQIVSVYANS